MLTPVLVAARIFANPVSNVFQKQLTQRGASPIFIIGAAHALLTLLCLPALIWLPWRALNPQFWLNICICAILAVSSNVLLVFALRDADLSVLGPINAYKPVVSLIPGIFLIGEIPKAAGLAGVMLIVAGSRFVIDRAGGGWGSRGVRLRFAALILSATEAVFLKKTLLLSSPLTTFIFWSILGLPVAAVAVHFLVRAPLRTEMERFAAHRTAYLGLALATGIMQLTTVMTFGRLQVGYSLALFQLSALVSVLLGHRFFQEGHVRKRLLGAGIMVAGAALIAAG